MATREGIDRILWELEEGEISIFETKQQLANLGVVIKAEIPDGWILIKPNGKEWLETGYTSCDVQPVTKQEIYLVESLIEERDDD